MRVQRTCSIVISLKFSLDILINVTGNFQSIEIKGTYRPEQLGNNSLLPITQALFTFVSVTAV